MRMKEHDIRMIVGIVICIAMIIIINVFEGVHDDDCWNDGHCTNGHSWVLLDIEKTKSDTYYYYYSCECGQVIEMYNMR